MPPTAKTSTDLLLNAAQTVVLRDGVIHLTLDAVAKEAGVSKGGVLHYFSSKNALFEGLVTRLMEAFEAEIEHRISADRVERGRFCRAYIGATLLQVQDELAMSAALLAAAATIEPRLLAQVRERYANWKARALTDGIDPEAASLLLLAADGFCFAQVFGLGNAVENNEEAVSLARAAERLTGAGTPE